MGFVPYIQFCLMGENMHIQQGAMSKDSSHPFQAMYVQ